MKNLFNKYFLATTWFCLTDFFSHSQTVVSFAMKDSTQPIQLNFVNGITSDSVFSCFCSSGSFVVPDVDFCPTITIDTKSEQHGYDFLYISLDKPTVDFTVSINDGLPELYFANDTFNQYYYDYANTLRPIKWQQRELNKLMRDTTQNVDSLYAVFKRLQQEFSNLQYAFYTEHGHQSRARLMYAHSKLASRSMSKDSVKAIIEGMRGYGAQMKQYGYCMNMLNDSVYIIKAGAEMPEMTFVNSKGTPLRNTEIKSGKVNYFFWATWCQGCKSEMAVLRNSRTKDKWIIVSVENDYERWKLYIANDGFLKHTYHYAFAHTDEAMFRMGANYLPYIIETENGVIMRIGARMEDVLGK